uniref:Deoxyhypusine synthase n=1 Tax=Toxocara canis TaxID=6265 RepID=A0A183V7U3_TOXCA
LIAELGAHINDESSICYWANRNNIPIFCPALTDGSLGDMLYFHSVRNNGIKLDIVEVRSRLSLRPDSGARPDEAVSWGKIKSNAESVKVFADASLVFPLIVARTFAKYVIDRKRDKLVNGTA